MGTVNDLKTVDLLGRGRIHPALHVDEAGVIVGVVTEAGEYRLLTSDRKAYGPDDVKAALAFLPRPYADLAGRWPEEDLDAFLRGEEAPAFSEALALTISTLDEAMEFPRPEHLALLATWSLATYYFRLFLTFPRFNFLGEKESGKSKLLTILRATAWNALLMLTPTPAVLYRLVHEFRPTMLLDEVEGLNKDDGREVLAIINSGYKAGGSVPRCEGERTKRVELFEVYSPLALAAIRPVNPVTEDRSIPIVLQRGTDRRRLNAEVDPAAPVFARIRAGSYRLLLTRWRDVRESYRTVALPDWLNGRARELWRPLLAVAALADEENGLQLTPDLLALAREHVEDREGLSAEAEALLAVLTDRLGSEVSATIRPGDLTEDLRKRLAWREPPTPHAVGGWLRRLGFRRTGKDREGARYEMRADQLADVRTRYGLTDGAPYAPLPPERNVTSSSSHPNSAIFQDV